MGLAPSALAAFKRLTRIASPLDAAAEGRWSVVDGLSQIAEGTETGLAVNAAASANSRRSHCLTQER
jgi:hypothetical protein